MSPRRFWDPAIFVAVFLLAMVAILYGTIIYGLIRALIACQIVECLP